MNYAKFSLAFSVDEENKIVTLEDCGHHDNIYKSFLGFFYIWLIHIQSKVYIPTKSS